QHGQHERGGLAGAGLGDADQVRLLEDVRDGLGLDLRGRGVARGCHRVGDFCAQPELVKCRCQIGDPVMSQYRPGKRRLAPGDGNWPLTGRTIAQDRAESTKSPGLRGFGGNSGPCEPQTSTSVTKAARSWMNSKRASGLLPIRRSTLWAVSRRSSTTRTRKRVRLAGFMVVSFKWACGISPRPLKRVTSILPRPVSSPAISSSLCASFMA